jgi:hypothetical protein
VRKTLMALVTSAMLAGPMVATPMETEAAPNVVIGDSLVNVQIVDVEVLKNVNVADVVDVVAAANVCPAISVDLAAIAVLVDQSGDSAKINCDADAENEVVITQNQPSKSKNR